MSSPSGAPWRSFLPLLLFAAAAPVVGGCGPRAPEDGRAVAPAAPLAVAVVAARAEELPDTVTAYGSLQAAERVRMAFLRPGRVVFLPVDMGSVIEAGEVVARLDTATAELQVQEAMAAVHQARVRLELPTQADAEEGERDDVDPESTALVREARAVLAEATLRRDRALDLARRELSPPAELEAATAAFAVAESRVQEAINEVRDRRAVLAQRRVELDLARRQLEESELHAPFDGVVAQRLIDVQEFVGAGEPVLSVLRVDTLRLRLGVAERDAARVRTGQLVRFTVDGAEGEFTGQIVRTSPEIRTDNRTVLVEAEVPNPDGRLRSGRFVRGGIEVSAPRPRTTLPRDSVVSFAGVARVFLIEDGQAVSRIVGLGRGVGTRIEILSGVAAGESVILRPAGLVEGRAVQATAAPPAATPGTARSGEELR